MKDSSGKILVIEDRLATIKLVSDTLIGAGHQVFVAKTGEKGIQRASKIIPDLIILDIMMPGIDGYETCDQIKKIPELADIPIIFSSALSETFDKVKAFNLGAVDYVTKPIEPLELVVRVNMHLSLYRLRHQLELEVDARTEQLKQQNQDLEIAWEQAKESIRAKEEFIAVLSHELRTPLNPIVSLAALLLEEVKDPNQLELLQYIYRSGQHMSDLVADLLQYASDAAKEPEVRRVELDLSDFCQKNLAYFHSCSKENKASFHWVITPEVPKMIKTDPLRLRQILENLLNNAFKFCAQGEVVLTCSLAGEGDSELVFSVHDEGIGIPIEKQQFIFDPFYQVDSSSTRPYQGVGLGLSIAKRIADKLGGRLRVESKEAKGTCFYLYLPLEI